MIPDNCRKCNSSQFYIEESRNNVGLYCKKCGAWQKWLNKDEVRLFNRNSNIHAIVSEERTIPMSDKVMEDIKSGKGLSPLPSDNDSSAQSENATEQILEKRITHEIFVYHDDKKDSDSKEKDYYTEYDLNLDSIKSLEDCKKILKLLCSMVMKPIRNGVAYGDDVEKYFNKRRIY